MKLGHHPTQSKCQSAFNVFSNQAENKDHICSKSKKETFATSSVLVWQMGLNESILVILL